MKTAIPILLFCVSLGHSHAADITVSELANKMPAGQLGKPLGSRIVLTGTSPKRPMLLTNPLEVSEVDGKPSADRVAISIRGEIEIQEGVTYRLEGYEAGEFSGPPEWLSGPGSPRPQAPFQYHSFFAVTKVIAPIEGVPSPIQSPEITAPQQWPPPLDEKQLLGSWVRKNQPSQGVENHTLLILREDHSWYEAEISGPLTEPVRFKKFAPDSKWEVVNVGEKNTQAMLLFKHKEGGSNAWNILKVGAEELDFSSFGPSIIDLRHYTRCDAQTAAKLNARLNQKETEGTAK